MMKLLNLMAALGVAVVLSGCANRLPTATPDVAVTAAPAQPYTVVRTSALRPPTVRPTPRSHRIVVQEVPAVAAQPRRTVYPAPPPASLEVLRNSRTLPQARATVIAPKGSKARVQTAASAPGVRRAAPLPTANAERTTTCVRSTLFATKPVHVLDPCGAGGDGRCTVPK